MKVSKNDVVRLKCIFTYGRNIWFWKKIVCYTFHSKLTATIICEKCKIQSPVHSRAHLGINLIKNYELNLILSDTQ